MLDSEEQVKQRLPVPMPKAKFRSSGDSDEDTADDVTEATPNAGNPEDGDLRSPPVQLSPWQTRFMRSPHNLTHIGMSLRSTVLP